MSVVLDASALIAIESSSDPHHEALIAALDELCDERWLIHPLTLIELLVVVAAEGPTAVRKYRDWLSELGVETRSDEPAFDIRQAANADAIAHMRATARLKLPDVLVLHAAAATKSALLTTDIRLRAAALRAGIEAPDLLGPPYATG